MGITGLQWAILVLLRYLCSAWHMTRLMLVSLFHILVMLTKVNSLSLPTNKRASNSTMTGAQSWGPQGQLCPSVPHGGSSERSFQEEGTVLFPERKCHWWKTKIVGHRSMFPQTGLVSNKVWGPGQTPIARDGLKQTL